MCSYCLHPYDHKSPTLPLAKPTEVIRIQTGSGSGPPDPSRPPHTLTIVCPLQRAIAAQKRHDAAVRAYKERTRNLVQLAQLIRNKL